MCEPVPTWDGVYVTPHALLWTVHDVELKVPAPLDENVIVPDGETPLSATAIVEACPTTTDDGLSWTWVVVVDCDAVNWLLSLELTWLFVSPE